MEFADPCHWKAISLVIKSTTNTPGINTKNFFVAIYSVFWLWQIKFLSVGARDPVSLGITLVFIVLIVMLQICIEVKKHVAARKEKENIQMAILAKKTLTNARLQVQCSTIVESASLLDQVILEKVKPTSTHDQVLLKDILCNPSNSWIIYFLHPKV